MNVPVVICPLDIERRALAKSLRGRAKIVVSGPGGQAVTDAVRANAGTPLDRPPFFVLFGVAGGLRATPTAPRIAWVMDRDGMRWDAPAVAPGSDDSIGVLGLDEAVSQPARKRTLAGAYGAALVDMESHAFAKVCDELKLEWAVVRGVSDGPDDTLLPDVVNWVNAQGKLRPMRTALGVLMNLASLPSLFRLRTKTNAALAAASGRIAELLGHKKISVNVAGKPASAKGGIAATSPAPGKAPAGKR